MARPSCPDDYLDETREAWDHFWQSDLPDELINVDLVAVQQYFRLYDRWLSLMAVAEATPFTEGSTGQVTSHPAVAQAHQFLEDMSKRGQELGITPGARRRLGIGTKSKALTAADINAMPGSRQGSAKKRQTKLIEGQWEAVD